MRHRAGTSNQELTIPIPHNQAGDVYPPGHPKRLTTYAKTALLITFGLIIALYTTKLDTEENKMFILASFTSLMFALLFELALFMLISCVESRNPNCFHCRYEERLYISIYGSNSLKMFAAYFLLLLCTYRYAYLVVFLFLALLVISILLKQGFKLKHTTSIKKYRGHDSDLSHFSELSSAVVLMHFTGLSAIVFSSPDLYRKNDQIKVTECFLFVNLVMSLLLMLFTSVPPAVDNDVTRVRMVRVVKFLSYTVLSILTLVGLMAAGEVLKGLVVFSTLAHVIGATYWLVTEVLDEHLLPVLGRSEGGLHTGAMVHTGDEKMELHTGAMVLANGAFWVLMYVYSKNVDNCEPYNWGYFVILAVCMISLCSTFISCLFKMVIFSHNQESPSSNNAKEILDYTAFISLFVALVFTIVLVFFSGHESENSCN